MHRHASRLLLAALVVGSAGCSDILFEDPDKTYDGPAVVEFAPVLPDGTYVRRISFPAGSSATQGVNVGVNYVASPPSSAVNGEVAVASGTTAVEGEDFVLSARGFTIPAGENVGTIPVEVRAAGLDDGETVSIILELQEGSGFQVSPNYRTFEIRVSKSGG